MAYKCGNICQAAYKNHVKAFLFLDSQYWHIPFLVHILSGWKGVSIDVWCQKQGRPFWRRRQVSGTWGFCVHGGGGRQRISDIATLMGKFEGNCEF